MNAHKDVGRWTTLRQLFGDNRAEWPAAQFGEIFVEPPYLNKLESKRPCFLIGGRGTGKTTSLQSLHYDSTLKRLEAAGLSFGDQIYYGILVRMNKNRVRAFQGRHLDGGEWSRLFAHYINLLACLELVGLAEWLEMRTECSFPASCISRVGIDLGLGVVDSLTALATEIKLGISKLQLLVNNPISKIEITLSIAESPLRTFVDALRESGLIDEQVVFCCFDEYENLLDYQQSVLNTYIKHATPPLSYKVGVRKNGLRSRHTLDGNDLLQNPDDFAEVEIAAEGFEYFAKAVAEQRLSYARKLGLPVPERLCAFLEELTLAEEAAMLGADEVATLVLGELRASGDARLLEFFESRPAHEVYFLRYWEKTGSEPLLQLASDWMENPDRWATRIGNYGFASLFWLSVGRKGARVRKYYCGERVLLLLAAGNIRYFLDLLDTSIGIQLGDTEPPTALVLSPHTQTLAAREVGKRRLNQLEGLADHGPQLKRLVLAIGKVFFERTRSPTRGTPEQNSFVLTGSAQDVERITTLLSEGVGHLAFEVEPRTKATSSVEMKDEEYRLHRIFSAFFEISHRKKRRTSFDAKDLLAVLEEKPSRAIAALLEGQAQSEGEALPEQLAFFATFYEEAQ